MSPSTPPNNCSFSSNFDHSFGNAPPHVDLQSMWNHQQDGFGEGDFGYSLVVPKEQSLPEYIDPYSMSSYDSSVSFYASSCSGFSNEGISTALSRPMFNQKIPPSTPPAIASNTNWSLLTIAQTPPRTIDPSTFAPLLPSTPTVKTEAPYTSSCQHKQSSFILSSSPMSGYSPGTVPSQREADDSASFDSSGLPQDAVDLAYETLSISINMRERERNRDHSRLSRRRYDRKGSRPGCKRRPVANKSVFECDLVITANSFACGYPECIDKNTGKQKRFKRAEHKKRHEKTVHQKESHVSHQCWVPQCERSFSRTDNLKSHLKNTHGKRSPNARNRYVATLDPNNSQYYSPDWEGDLTSEGLPIRIRAGLAKF